jgi:disulfide bond formation protein DsbB
LCFEEDESVQDHPFDFLCRHAAKVALIASIGALAAAYGSQIFGGLAPCVLCLYQRIPYAIVIGLGLIALTLEYQGREDLAWNLLPISGFAFLVGSGIAGFHVGVEQHWWQGTEACVGSSGATTLADLEAQIMASPVTRCDEAPWSLFGISMAGYNMVASLTLAVFCAVAMQQQRRDGNAL